jgi:hypothetical protein
MANFLQLIILVVSIIETSAKLPTINIKSNIKQEFNEKLSALFILVSVNSLAEKLNPIPSNREVQHGFQHRYQEQVVYGERHNRQQDISRNVNGGIQVLTAYE